MDHQTCHPKAWCHLSCAQFERLPNGWRAQVREVLGPAYGDGGGSIHGVTTVRRAAEPPNGFELSCPAARATAHPFSHILAG